MYGWIISAAALPVVVVISSSSLLCALLLFRCVAVAAVKEEEDTEDDDVSTTTTLISSYPIANNDNRAPSPIVSVAIIKTEEIDTDNEDENIDNNNRAPIQVVLSTVVKSEYQEDTDDEDDINRASSPIICCWNEAHHLRLGFFGELIKFIESVLKRKSVKCLKKRSRRILICLK